MTRKLIAVATALGATVLLAAGPADAKPKTPNAYVDVDNSGSWTSGDADVSDALASTYSYVLGGSGSRVAEGDLIVNKVSSKYFQQILNNTGDVTITGSVKVSDGPLFLYAPNGAVNIEAGARISATEMSVEIKAETVNVGERARISHKAEGPSFFRIEGDDVTIGANAKITSLVSNRGYSPDYLVGDFYLTGHNSLTVDPTAKILAPKSNMHISGANS